MAKCVVCGVDTENCIKVKGKEIIICKKCSDIKMGDSNRFEEALKKAVKYNPKKKS